MNNFLSVVLLMGALIGLCLAYIVFQGVKLYKINRQLRGKGRRPFCQKPLTYDYYEKDDTLTINLD